MDLASQKSDLLRQINAGAKIQCLGPMGTEQRASIAGSRVIDQAVSVVVASGRIDARDALDLHGQATLLETADPTTMIFVDVDNQGGFSFERADRCNTYPEPTFSTLPYQLDGSLTDEQAHDPQVLKQLAKFNFAKQASDIYLDELIDQRRAGKGLGALTKHIDQILVIFKRIDHEAKVSDTSKHSARRQAHAAKVSMLDSISKANALLAMAGAGGVLAMHTQATRLIQGQLALSARQNPAIEISNVEKITADPALLFSHIAESAQKLNALFAPAAVSDVPGHINSGLFLKTLPMAVKLAANHTHEKLAEKNSALVQMMRDLNRSQQVSPLFAKAPDSNVVDFKAPSDSSNPFSSAKCQEEDASKAKAPERKKDDSEPEPDM